MAYHNGPKGYDPSGRVAIYMPSLGMGGAERVMLNLARSLVGRGVKIDLVLAQAEGPYLAQVPPEIHIVDLGSRRVLQSLPYLVCYLRKARPQCLLSAMNYANIIAIWARSLARVPTRLIISEHVAMLSGTAMDEKLANSRLLVPERLLMACMAHFYPWADKVVAVSNGTADALAQTLQFPRHGIQVIYNSVLTPDVFQKAHEHFDHPWFNPGEPPVILAVGRLHQQKDYPTLLHAFARVRKHRPARLLILGEGPERAELERMVQQLKLVKDISLPGIVDNPYMYMARAAVFVLSSAWEGLPTVLIEALAVGAPVISTRCPSGPEEILEDGRYGVLTPVGDPELLACAIQDTISSRPQPFVDFSFLDKFRPEKTADEYMQVLGIVS